MKNQQKQTFLIGIMLIASVLFCLTPRMCWSDEGLATEAQVQQAVQEIRQAIAEKGANWVAGETEMMYMPTEQLCGSELHPEARMAVTSSSDDGPLPTGSPAALDWRNYGGHDWTTGIRNQNPCGSCYIFGTCGASEAAMKVQAGTYGYLAQPDFSEQLILSCAGIGDCSGGYSGNSLDYLRDSGSTDEDCFPYTALDTTPCSDRCANWSDRIQKITSWDHPGGYPNWTPSVAQIKTAIETYGPVSTYMEVYWDFNSYRGGVYEYTWGTLRGGHTVTLVGWIDSQSCWIAKNSWGPDWGETIDFQPTSAGATDGGWFRIKWGEVEIERQTEFVQAGMANLTDNPHTGWTYSLVPRNTTGTTWASCPLPATLNGNQNTTYLNFAGTNNGSQTAPPFTSHFFIDGVYVRWASWGKILAGQNFVAYDLGAHTVKGGRHTIGIELDINDQVWESNETYSDNAEYRQFIWSPYYLSDNTPTTRGTPPDKDAWGNAPTTWYNNDGFEFAVLQEHPDKWWSAVGILPSSSGADYDLRLWDIGDYTGSEEGFGSGYLKQSSYGGSASDFVIVNDNMAAAGTYYAGAINYNAGSGDFRIEEDTSEKIFPRPGTEWNGPYSKTTTNVLDIYEVYLYAGVYYFYLDQTSGTCDLAMSLYDDETTQCQKSEYMSGGYANSYGDGGDESFQITIPDSGFHCLVVWKYDSSDYDKSATYKLAVGTPTLEVATPNGGETWYIGSTYLISWDRFCSDNYVNIDLSLDAGATWSRIASNVYNDGSHWWKVDSCPSTQSRIRVTSTTNSAFTDTSDANFTIAIPTPNYPYPPQNWTLRSPHTNLQWNSYSGNCVVVPTENTNVEGSSDNGYPFHIGSWSLSSMRYQQIYDAVAFTGEYGTISEIRFRPDGTSGIAFSDTPMQVEIYLGYSANPVASPSATFANNIGSEYVKVYDGTLTLSSDCTGGPPRDFDIVVDVADTFTYDPQLGPLLLDVKMYDGPTTTFFDAAGGGAQNSTNRIYATNVSAATGSTGSPPYGLVTMFCFDGGMPASTAVAGGENVTLVPLRTTGSIDTMAFDPVPGESARVKSSVSTLSDPGQIESVAIESGQMDLTTSMEFQPVEHQDIGPIVTQASGCGNILWDLTHGMYSSTYSPFTGYSTLTSLLQSKGFAVYTTDVGIENVNLNDYDILVVCLGSAWDSAYTTSEVAAIETFVANGGGLLIMGDNAGCPNANINPVATSFGVTCGVSTISDLDLYITNLADHAIFSGCSQLYYRAAGEISASTPAVPAAWAPTGEQTVAYCSSTSGAVVVTGEISFCHNDYITTSDNQQFIENIFHWLLTNKKIRYDVYFGKTYPPTTKIASDLKVPVCDPTPIPLDTLDSCQWYYWQVVAEVCGQPKAGPFWAFKTRHLGDINANGPVNLKDYAVLAMYWQDDLCHLYNWCDEADVNHDMNVDLVDLYLIVQDWLETCP
ncbi:MAG: hypothetical protein JXD22_05455 [Sedimentisphaerales bacterium]|nr:hypothetical protein [Sedimentisphaerales bacterium]